MINNEKNNKRLNKVILTSSIIGVVGIGAALGTKIYSVSAQRSDSLQPLIQIFYKGDKNEATYTIQQGYDYEDYDASLFLNVVNNETYNDGLRFTIEPESIRYSYTPYTSNDGFSYIAKVDNPFSLGTDGKFNGAIKISENHTLVGNIHCDAVVKDNKTGTEFSTDAKIPCRFECIGNANENIENFHAELVGEIIKGQEIEPGKVYLQFYSEYNLLIEGKDVIFYNSIKPDIFTGLNFCKENGDVSRVITDGRLYISGTATSDEGLGTLTLGIMNSTRDYVYSDIPIYVESTGSNFNITHTGVLSIYGEIGESEYEEGGARYIKITTANGDPISNTTFEIESLVDNFGSEITFGSTHGESSDDDCKTNNAGVMYINGIKTEYPNSYLLKFSYEDAGSEKFAFLTLHILKQAVSRLLVDFSPSKTPTVTLTDSSEFLSISYALFSATDVNEQIDITEEILDLETAKNSFGEIVVSDDDNENAQSFDSIDDALNYLQCYCRLSIDDNRIVLMRDTMAFNWRLDIKRLKFKFTPVLKLPATSYQSDQEFAVNIRIKENNWK